MRRVRRPSARGWSRRPGPPSAVSAALALDAAGGQVELEAAGELGAAGRGRRNAVGRRGEGDPVDRSVVVKLGERDVLAHVEEIAVAGAQGPVEPARVEEAGTAQVDAEEALEIGRAGTPRVPSAPSFGSRTIEAVPVSGGSARSSSEAERRRGQNPRHYSDLRPLLRIDLRGANFLGRLG